MNGATSNLRLIGFAIAFAVAAFSWALTCAAWRFDKVAAGVVPLDPRSFERMTLVVLGSAGAHPDPNRRGPALAFAVEREIALVDLGRGVAESLRAAKIPATQPRTVLLSGLMPQNTVGLDDLLAVRWIEGATAPLALYGPPGTAALAREVEAAVRPAAQALQDALGSTAPLPGIEVHEVDDGFTLAQGALNFRAGALPAGPTGALAWHVEWRGRTAVVSSAGWAPDALVEQAKGAHLWVHYAVMLPPPDQAKELGIDEDPEVLRRQWALHTDVTQVGSLAQRAGVGTLVLVRLRPPPVYDFQITSLIDDAYTGRIVVSEDGQELTP